MTKVEIRKINTQNEDSYTYYMYTASIDGQDIGSASVMTDDKSTYVDRIDIDEAHRNHGYGTAFLMALRGIYGRLVIAPDNEDARRLYDRLGEDVSRDYWMVDQGLGVYAI